MRRYEFRPENRCRIIAGAAMLTRTDCPLCRLGTHASESRPATGWTFDGEYEDAIPRRHRLPLVTDVEGRHAPGGIDTRRRRFKGRHSPDPGSARQRSIPMPRPSSVPHGRSRMRRRRRKSTTHAAQTSPVPTRTHASTTGNSATHVSWLRCSASTSGGSHHRGLRVHSSRGRPGASPNFRRRHLLPAVERSDELPDDLRWHDLRHTCSAFLIASGRHMEEVKDYLGHSSIRVTSDRYGHLFPGARRDGGRARRDVPDRVRESRGLAAVSALPHGRANSGPDRP